MGTRTTLLHGSAQPNSLRRDQLYIQHDPNSNKVLGIWAGAKNDERKCIVSVAVKHVTGAYSVLQEDKIVGVDTTGGAVTVTLPAPADINDGHQVIIDDEGGNAGTANITIATPGAETVEGSATLAVSTNDAVTTLIYDAENSNWISV